VIILIIKGIANNFIKTIKVKISFAMHLDIIIREFLHFINIILMSTIMVIVAIIVIIAIVKAVMVEFII